MNIYLNENLARLHREERMADRSGSDARHRSRKCRSGPG